MLLTRKSFVLKGCPLVFLIVVVAAFTEAGSRQNRRVDQIGHILEYPKGITVEPGFVPVVRPRRVRTCAKCDLPPEPGGAASLTRQGEFDVVNRDVISLKVWNSRGWKVQGIQYYLYAVDSDLNIEQLTNLLDDESITLQTQFPFEKFMFVILPDSNLTKSDLMSPGHSAKNTLVSRKVH